MTARSDGDQMKAIFLDIDGVIATPTSFRANRELWREPEEYRYDRVSLAFLGQLVARTGAQVVLSSSWRADLDSNDPVLDAIVGNLLRQLEAFGAPVTDVTPSLPGGDRSAEIGAWLEKHPCEAYAIIDDRARFEARPEIAEGHLVLVENSNGIRQPHFSQALSMLE